MTDTPPRPDAASRPHSIACVSFLNSKPLIEPLIGRADVQVHFAVPAKLLGLIEAGEASAGLLPVVDYHASAVPLVLVPAGAIGCDGPTLTVRIYSKVPPGRIRQVHGDTDSHTSVILAQVVLRELYGVAPPMVPLAAREGEHRGGHETMLLIGDKVVNARPPPQDYPYQLDLGEQWKELTGLPFVFAMWMMRKDRLDMELARLLAQAQRQGAEMTEALLDRYATDKGWPRELARRYFTEYLKYDVSERSRRGLGKFYTLAARHGLIRATRAVEYLEIA